MSRASKSWWRIQVDGAGKVVDCRVVESAEEDGADVFFVRASTRAEAGRRAWNAYTSRLNKRRRARYIAEGRCGYCGRAQDREPKKRCSVCLKKHAGHKARSDARLRGEEVAPADRAASIAARAEEQRQQIRAESATSTRLAVLLEVQEAWQGSSNNATFTRWIWAELAKIAGRRVA